MSEVQLVRYSAACHALAEAKATDEVKDIRNKAEAMRAYAKQANNRQLEVDAAEIRMRAERRLGQLLVKQKETVGLRGPQHSRGGGSKGSTREPLPSAPPTLAEAGIDKKLSSRAQKLAAVPDEQFEGMVGEWRGRIADENERVTVNLLKEGERAQRHAELNSAPTVWPDGKYAVIYADPPWAFETWSADGKDRSAENYYPTMSQADLEALPVSDLAADDCLLLMWAVMPRLPDALALIEAWGFQYKTCAFVWVKQTNDGTRFATGLGYWTRANAELCLLATRGAPKRVNADVHQVVAAPRQEHSQKPDEIMERVERLIAGPYVELFARRPREGWDAWGNQAP